MRIGVIHGPNLNRLGRREPEIYGRTTLASLNAELETWANSCGVDLCIMQSNHEGELVDAVQQFGDECQGILMNAAAYTHTSVALRDAVSGVSAPVLEIHISNVFARESFRHRSLLAPVCMGGIYGMGVAGYLWGLRMLVDHLDPGRMVGGESTAS